MTADYDAWWKTVEYQWHRNRGFRRFNEPGPPSPSGPRVVGHIKFLGKTLRKIIKIVATK